MIQQPHPLGTQLSNRRICDDAHICRLGGFQKVALDDDLAICGDARC